MLITTPKATQIYDNKSFDTVLVEAFGLPLLPPYLALNKTQDIQHGVNFAVAGATALDPEFFYQRKIGPVMWTNDSLSTQLGWFKKLKPSLCSTKQGNNSICNLNY